MTENRRLQPRKNAFVFGSLQIVDRSLHLDCLVWDESAIGAMIEVSGIEPVPDRFILTSGPEKPPRPCRVARRDGRRVGVVFE